MKTKKILKKINWYIFFITVIFLAIVPLFRFVLDKPIIGQESYYHLRIAQQITKTGLPTHDKLSNSNYILNPLHIPLALFVYIMGEKATSILFPFLFGILSIIIYIKLLGKLNIDPVKKFFISAILITSPIFIYAFSTVNSFILPIFLNLLGFYFFIQENKSAFYLSILIFALIPFFGLFNLLVTIIMLLAYSNFEKTKLKNFYFTSFILLLISLVYYTPLLYPFFFPAKIIFDINILTNIIFELGTTTGFRIFTLLLAILGFFKLWSEENKRTSLFILLLLFQSSFFVTNLTFYLNFIMPIPAAYGLLTLIKMRWKVELIKKSTLAILIISLLLSSFSSIGTISVSQPTNQIIDSLAWLKSNSKENEKVLSYFTNSFWIQKIADRPTLTDQLLKNNLLYTNLFNISHTIFYSRNIEITTSLLQDNNITYIWIDQNMKTQQVWTKPDQGLLFLLENSEIFKKIYNKNDIEIWEFDSTKLNIENK
ncbi:glycosyltransferase family 39 protein [Candidatus Woesearchaeota archaeon]|nr:glycosyltransferase family 39 protein [Candidatus Woesearchaeota archaeon]